MTDPTRRGGYPGPRLTPEEVTRLHNRLHHRNPLHQDHLHVDMQDEFRQVRAMAWRFILLGLAAFVLGVSILATAIVLVVRALT